MVALHLKNLSKALEAASDDSVRRTDSLKASASPEQSAGADRSSLRTLAPSSAGGAGITTFLYENRLLALFSMSSRQSCLELRPTTAAWACDPCKTSSKLYSKPCFCLAVYRSRQSKTKTTVLWPLSSSDSTSRRKRRLVENEADLRKLRPHVSHSCLAISRSAAHSSEWSIPESLTTPTLGDFFSSLNSCRRPDRTLSRTSFLADPGAPTRRTELFVPCTIVDRMRPSSFSQLSRKCAEVERHSRPRSSLRSFLRSVCNIP
mmetsp:Transcript_5380/g.19375  ORF Transcript_5380/g.19375 Transcript_5380/m.19375 type:complete len:262 (-) Transcript_5380:256-1041(-)